jgi:hypothetical protein
MELASIKNDTVLLLYHPAEPMAAVGQYLAILERPDQQQGLVVQVIANDLLDYEGLLQGMMQRVLEERLTHTNVVLDHEEGMEALRSLKIARAKIRKRVVGKAWQEWDGWVPTRNVTITLLERDSLLGRLLSPRPIPLEGLAHFGGAPITLDARRLGHISVITAVKGAGKSHLSKLLLLGLNRLQTPVLIFDLNGEYETLPNVQVLRWQDNFRLHLEEVGPGVLRSLVASFYPLAAGSPSEATFDNTLPQAFRSRRQYCQARGLPNTIDLLYLRDHVTWPGGAYVATAIQERLSALHDMGLFYQEATKTADEEADLAPPASLRALYAQACHGCSLIFDLRDLSDRLRQALVRVVLRAVEQICRTQIEDATNQLPYLIYDEAHFYLPHEAILNVVTRARHLGMGAVFTTNSPGKLPEAVFQQLDNLVLLRLHHEDDMRAVSKTAYVDADTVHSLATRLPRHHALIAGSLTDGLPMVVSVDALPDRHLPLLFAAFSVCRYRAWRRQKRTTCNAVSFQKVPMEASDIGVTLVIWEKPTLSPLCSLPTEPPMVFAREQDMVP